MSTSEAPSEATLRTPVVDSKLAKRFAMVCGAIPALLLAWDAYRHQLGANAVNFAIRTTGMLGLVFLTLSLAITPLRRLTGWNLLIAPRRNLGVLGFLYIATHFFIFYAYDRAGSVASTLSEIGSRVYLWFGTGALLLMVPLALTSTDGMVARLGAKRWKRLHRLAYPVALAGVVHYYLLVKADTRQPIAFAVVLSALLLHRIVAPRKVAAKRAAPAPGRSFWSGELGIGRIVQETEDVKTFRLASLDGGPLPFTWLAGQYLTLKLTIDGKRVNRTYTIASPPTRTDSCEISVKRTVNGYGSAHLHDTWREGQVVKVSAPVGKFTFTGEGADRVVLVAGGIGITPMMSVIRALTDRSWPGQIFLLYSARRVRDLAFREELARLAARFPNLHLHLTVTQDPAAAWDGGRGNITLRVIEDFVADLPRSPVLLCGPDAMMTAMRSHFVALGVPDAEIRQEAFISPARTGEGDAEAAEVPDGVDLREGRRVEFQRAGKVVSRSRGLTVLEAAEQAEVDIPYECRSGICGQCKTRLVSGRVVMETRDALTAAEQSRGLFLACQARAVEDLIVDA